MGARFARAALVAPVFNWTLRISHQRYRKHVLEEVAEQSTNCLCNGLQPNSNGLHPSSDGLHPYKRHCQFIDELYSAL